MAIYAQNPNMSEADMRRIEHILGLDQPVHIQYLKWAAGMATGNMGYSYRTGRSVGEVIRERVPATVQLMAFAYLIAIVLGIATGIVSAIRRHRIFDYCATTGAMVGLSVPTFWFGLMVIIVFAAMLRWIPSRSIATLGAPFSLYDRFIHLIGPASVLGLWMTATWVVFATFARRGGRAGRFLAHAGRKSSALRSSDGASSDMGTTPPRGRPRLTR